MYLKTYNTNHEVVIVNVNMADTKLIRLDGTTLVFEMKDGENKTHNLMTKERADMALEALFIAVGSNAPMDKSLDLTFSKQDDNQPIINPKQTDTKGKILEEDKLKSKPEDNTEEVE